jgi:hypothetical protein
MRKTNVFIAVLLVFIAVACKSTQHVPPTSGPLSVECTTGCSKDEAYIKAMLWMNHTFNQAKSVINYEDKDLGVIMGKYLVLHQSAGQYSTEIDNYTIIDIKITDDIARMVLTPDYQTTPMLLKNSWVEAIKASNQRLMTSFQAVFAQK